MYGIFSYIIYLKNQPNVGNIPYMDPMGNILIVSIGWRVTSTVWLECTHEIVTFPGRNQVAVFIENSFHVLVVHLWTHWISRQISRGKSLATAVESGSEMFHLYITARAVNVGQAALLLYAQGIFYQNLGKFWESLTHRSVSRSA